MAYYVSSVATIIILKMAKFILATVSILTSSEDNTPLDDVSTLSAIKTEERPQGVIMIDNYTLNSIGTMLSIFDDVIRRYETNKKVIKDVDDELNDIEHVIEFANIDAVERLKVYAEYKEARQRRRELKNENNRLRPFYKLLQENEDFRHKLTRVSSQVKDKTRAQHNKGYEARVRGDLVNKYLE